MTFEELKEARGLVGWPCWGHLLAGEGDPQILGAGRGLGSSSTNVRPPSAAFPLDGGHWGCLGIGEADTERLENKRQTPA